MSNPQKEKEKFADKVKRKTFYDNCQSHSDFQPSESFFPETQHCEICNKDFDDYNKHVALKEHCSKMKVSKANEYILELEKIYFNNNRNEKENKKTKVIRKSRISELKSRERKKEGRKN